MSVYAWNRLTPDTCTCGFERKAHLADRCPWDRDELVAMQRAAMNKREKEQHDRNFEQ